MSAARTLANAWLVHIELHVGNDTRHLHQVIYAETKVEAVAMVAELKPDYRGNLNHSYILQIKSGPFRLRDNFDLLEEY